MAKTSVLIVGLEPSLIDFSDPAYAAPGLNAAKIRAGLEADEAHLNELGYNAELCLIDFGETAETVLRERLAKHSFDCIMRGGRTVDRPKYLSVREARQHRACRRATGEVLLQHGAGRHRRCSPTMVSCELIESAAVGQRK